MKCKSLKKLRVVIKLASFLVIGLFIFSSVVKTEEVSSTFNYGLVSENEAIAIADLWYRMELNSGYLNINETERMERLNKLNNHKVFYLMDQGILLETNPRDSIVLGYVIEYEPTGFVIVAGSDRVVPIVAFDLTSELKWGNPDDNAFIDYLLYVTQPLWKIIDLKIHPTWENLRSKLRYQKGYENVKFSSSKDSSTYIHWYTPKWDQKGIYNDVVQQESNTIKDIATGCTATTMAELFRFHNWPIKGINPEGLDFPKKYEDKWSDFIFISQNDVDFDHVYNWDNMPLVNVIVPNLDIASLMWECGVAVNMDYGDSSSANLNYNNYIFEDFFSYKGTEYYDGLENLFDIDKEYRDEISKLFSGPDGIPCNGDDIVIVYNVPNEIEDAFEDNGRKLSQNLVFVKETCNERWPLIDDGNGISYVLNFENDKIRVYRLKREEMTEVIKTNLRAGLPIPASSLRHSMVIEGYRDDTPDPYYCVNDGAGNRVWQCVWGDLYLGHTAIQDNPIHVFYIIGLHAYCQPTNHVYVDPSYSEKEKDGSLKKPFNNFQDGYNAVPIDGDLWLKAGSYNIAPMILDKKMTIRVFLDEGSAILPISTSKSKVSLDEQNDLIQLSKNPIFIKVIGRFINSFPIFEKILNQ